MVTFTGKSEIGVSQTVNAGTTSNDGDQEIIDAIAQMRAETVDNTNAFTITNVASTYLWERNATWRFTDAGSPPTAQITLTVPTTPERGSFNVINATSQAMAVETSAQVLASPVLAAGDAGVFSNDGTNVELVSSGAAADFLSLSDTPASYSGQSGKVVGVVGSALAFVDQAAGAGAGFIAVSPEWKGALLEIGINQSTASGVPEDMAWTGASDQVSFDPGDGGPLQRFWFGPNWTFVDGDVTPGTDQIAETAHGYQTGEGPVRLTNSGGALPAGLAVNTNYWIIRVDANNLKFATSRVNALAGTAVDITAAAGGGTHTVDQAEYIVIPAGVSRVDLGAQIRWNPSDTGERHVVVAVYPVSISWTEVVD